MHERRGHKGPDWPQSEAIKQRIEQIAVPAEIDETIRKGMRLGRQCKRRRMAYKMASFAAGFLFLASLASIRLSPAVAAYVGDIPALRPLVNLIHYDKGLMLALDHNFMQPVNLSDEHDGIKLTVDGILIDESKAVVFYTLYNTDGRERIVNLRDVKLTNHHNNSISFGSSEYKEDWQSKQGTIEFYWMEETNIPDKLDLELIVGENIEPIADRPIWRIIVPVDKSRFEGLKETYDVQTTVTVEGQRITFGKMTVYPTRIGLEVTYDPANTKQLFAFDDLRIEDEYGEVFGKITNGQSAVQISENHHVIYFQSNYFQKPNRLFLKASSIRALDKGKLNVQVDLERKELLTRPDDRLILDSVSSGQKVGNGAIVFRLRNDDPRDENSHYQIFGMQFTDDTGRLFDSSSMGSSGDQLQYYVKAGDYKSPLILRIVDYPARINGDIHIRIK